MADARMIEQSPSCELAAWKNVGLVLLRALPEPADVHRLADVVGDLRRDTGLAVGLVHVVRTGLVKPPSEATRNVYRDLMRDPYSPLGGSAVVLEEAGFLSALVSSVITGLELVSRPSFSTRMFSSARAGATWLAAELDKRDASFGTPDDLVEILRHTFGDRT